MAGIVGVEWEESGIKESEGTSGRRSWGLQRHRHKDRDRDRDVQDIQIYTAMQRRQNIAIHRLYRPRKRGEYGLYRGS